MSKNSHRQKHNGFSFAFRLTRRTSDHKKKQKRWIFIGKTNSNANVSNFADKDRRQEKDAPVLLAS
jgi:hypothetical protein